jgi:hypothetical protein
VEVPGLSKDNQSMPSASVISVQEDVSAVFMAADSYATAVCDASAPRTLKSQRMGR